MKKIIDYKVVMATQLEDFTPTEEQIESREKTSKECFFPLMPLMPIVGLNSQVAELLKQGYELTGLLQHHVTTYEGSHGFKSTSTHYTRELVKYEE